MRQKMPIVPLPEEWMPLLHECVAIAYQNVEDEDAATLIKELMVILEEAEINKDGIGPTQVVLGSGGRWRLQ